MEVHFLQAHQALTKVFAQQANGSIEVTSYLHASAFKLHKHNYTSLSKFYQDLAYHAAAGHCLLKGLACKDLDFESRAGATNANTPTEFIVIDVDGLPDHDPEGVMAKMGLSDVSYILQYSASSGITKKDTLSCHIILMLTKPVLPSQLKEWLIHQNITHFSQYVYLTKARCALHYPIDITACQNDKLIYIAPPKCLPPSLNPFLPEQRIKLVQKLKPTFDFPASEDFSLARIKVEIHINTLRDVLGLPKRKTYATKFEGSQDYLPNPDIARVTGVKKERGYTYLNLNGGDSWAYWHPDDNFEYIHNFKGEPTYKTSELLPGYYWERRNDLVPKDVKHYVFRDPRADAYYSGWYNQHTQTYSFLPTGSKPKLVDYMGQYGLQAPKQIPDWQCVFDPFVKIQVDPANKYWNRFVPSKYMLQPALPQTKVPETILALIRHVVSPQPEVVHAFFNWLAFAYQFRRAAGTAWILQGVPGTGKGILMNYVIKALFGATNYTARRMEELEDKFNGYLENCLICYVDEVHIGASKRSDIILANLKNQITEPRITIRNMRQMAYEVPNYLNWILSSNMTTPIELDKEDRRFNVGVYQTHPIRDVFPDTTALVAQLESELTQFADYLASFQVDQTAVRLPVKNEARQELIDNSKTSLDVISEAITKGDLELLVSFISHERDVMLQIKSDSYSDLLKDIAKTGRTKITRDELRTIFLYTVGDAPASPAKFTRFLAHRGIKLTVVRIGDKVYRGMEVNWVITDELRHQLLTGSATPHLKVVHDAGLSGIQRSDG